MMNKSVDLGTIKNDLIEDGFNLPLSTKVEGISAFGKNFEEKTVLSYISHHGSSFWLKNHVALGSELRLSVELPPKLSQDKNLKLIIRGKVIFVESPKNNHDGQRVSLKFENKYIISEDG